MTTGIEGPNGTSDTAPHAAIYPDTPEYEAALRADAAQDVGRVTVNESPEALDQSVWAEARLSEIADELGGV